MYWVKSSSERFFMLQLYAVLMLCFGLGTKITELWFKKRQGLG